MKTDRGNDPAHVRACNRLRRGDLIVVKFGAHGGQLAEVLGTRTSGGRIPVRKFRRRSGAWTLRTFVRVGEVVSIPKARREDTLRRWGVEAPRSPAARVATEAARDELRTIYGRLG